MQIRAEAQYPKSDRAILGVKLNLIIPEEQVKVILYLVVLLSGISILVRKDESLRIKRKKAFPLKEICL